MKRISYRSISLALGLLVLAIGLALLLNHRPSLIPTTAGNDRGRNRIAMSEPKVGEVREHWHGWIRLEPSDLNVQAVQFAIFSENPQEVLKGKLRGKPWTDRAIVWDFLFNKVPGDELYLLVPGTNGTVELGSNAPGGKKWLVTKSVHGVYSWSVPFQASVDEDFDIVLTKANVIELNALALE